VYKVIIIDDEQKPRDVLAMKITDECPELTIVGTADSAESGYQLCQKMQPDIVFLDVNMPKESGFDFISKFTEVPFEIIFSTAYEQYALEAFKVAAVGYLLKPVKTEDLKIAVTSALTQLNLKNTGNKLSTLLHNMKPANAEKKKLVIPATDRYEFVNIDQIVLCESTDKYTYLHTDNGQKILSSQYLGWYKSILEPLGFFVPHKSFIINLKYINSLTHDDEILMKTSTIRVPLARRRKSDFLQAVAMM
jgi:two-component system, LytTR family, response regulator